jgi:hypothetical protein
MNVRGEREGRGRQGAGKRRGKTNRQPGQPRGRAFPETQDALFGEDPVAAVDEVSVFGSGGEGLHAGFDDTFERGGQGRVEKERRAEKGQRRRAKGQRRTG